MYVCICVGVNTMYVHTEFYIQSRRENELYSVAYFDGVTAFKVLH